MSQKKHITYNQYPIIKRIQFDSLSREVSFGGPGKLNITSLASCDLLVITSFNFTAVCIRLTLPSSLILKIVASVMMIEVLRFVESTRLIIFYKLTESTVVFLSIWFYCPSSIKLISSFPRRRSPWYSYYRLPIPFHSRRFYNPGRTQV